MKPERLREIESWLEERDDFDKTMDGNLPRPENHEYVRELLAALRLAREDGDTWEQAEERRKYECLGLAEKLDAEGRALEKLAGMCGGQSREKECPCTQYDWDETTGKKWCWDGPACMGKTPKECWLRLAREEIT